MSHARCAVAVIALHGGDTLHACIRAVEDQAGRCTVMLSGSMGTAAAWSATHPASHFVEAADLSVPAKRAAALRAADAEFVALLEDNAIPQPGWWDAVQAAAATPDVAAASGPVTLGERLSTRQKALGCCEYGRFHPARLGFEKAGPGRSAGAIAAEHLPGNNLAYRRATLRLELAALDGIVETSAHADLRARGCALVLHPGMQVEYSPRDDRGTRLIDRLRHGRLYGATLVTGRSAAYRAACLLRSLALPFVLSARSLSSMTRAVRPASWPVVALRVCCMETAWSLGEAVGCVAGRGRSLERWT